VTASVAKDSFADNEYALPPASLIVLVFVACYHIFFTKGVIEDRWTFLIAPFLFYFAANGMNKIGNYLNRYWKHIGIILIIGLLAFTAFLQINHAGALIENKKGSYYPVQEASLWMKENSNKNDIIMSISFTQVTAYSARRVDTYSRMDENNFTRYIKENKPKYFMVSVFEPHPSWSFQQLQGNDGSTIWRIPYLNSSLVITPQGQIANYDIKNEVERDGIRFVLVYPDNQVNGAFVYRIEYN
jgi:energy-coupling factor transporter transmembrane protein EcfT